MKKYYVALLLMALTASAARGADFMVGGISYELIGSNQVAVTAGTDPYSGFVTIPQTVSIYNRTYQVTTISDAAFYGCSMLTFVNLPASVSKIGSEAFGRCTSLRAINVDAANEQFCSENGVLMNKKKTQLLAFPNNSATAYSVPGTITEIGPWAFLYCDRLQSVQLPAGLATISDAAFYGCSQLKSVNIPHSVTTIGQWAFSECSALPSVSLPASVKQIGQGAFSFCPALTDIYVDANNTVFASLDGLLTDRFRRILIACPGGKGPALRINESIDSIAPQAFYGCNGLTSLRLPSALSALGQNPFVFCENLQEIAVDRNNATLASRDGVLLSRDEQTIVSYPNARDGAYTLPQTVSSIDHGPFLCSTALSALTIPESCTTIGNWAFLGCSGLRSVSLPTTLTTLGEEAFAGCGSLQTVICGGDAPLSATAFDDDTYEHAMLCVPRGSLADYKAADGWSRFVNYADYGLYTTGVTVDRGRRQLVPIRMSHGLPVSALQFDLQLPEGMVIDTDAAGNYLLQLDPGNATSHAALCQPLERAASYRISVSSTSGLPLATCDTLLTLTLLAPTESELGSYDMHLSNISCVYVTDSHRGEAVQKDLTETVGVSMIRGDVNRNGRLNVADIVETVRYLRGTPTANFHFDEADVNGNGEVNTADAVLTVDQIHATRHTAWWSEPLPAYVSATAALSADSVLFYETDEAPLLLRLSVASADYAAFQAEVVLPQGFLLTADNSQRLSVAQVLEDANTGQTVYSIVYAPLDNRLPVKAALSEAQLYIKATPQVLPGDYSAQLRNVMMADEQAAELFCADLAVPIHVVSTAGINRPVAGQQGLWPADVYNLEGVRVRQAATSLSGLPRGIYIVKGSKMKVKGK